MPEKPDTLTPAEHARLTAYYRQRALDTCPPPPESFGVFTWEGEDAERQRASSAALLAKAEHHRQRAG